MAGNHTNLNIGSVSTAPFFGRDVEIELLTKLVTTDRARLITLCGVGGVGKTRLARHVMQLVAGSFAGGTRLVPLAAVPDPNQVADTIAHAFGLGAAGVVTARDRLLMHLAQRHMLLVLDNFEHVTDAAVLIAELLNVAPRLVILITSRSPLHLFGERVVDLAPLSVADLDERATSEVIARNPAVRLFIDRAVGCGASLELMDDGVVAEICRRLDGLPLAIELAASHA